MEQSTTDRQYSADELAAAAGIQRRTLRYYIQLGLVDPPVGQTRAAHYGWQHLRQLLEVRNLSAQGLSLEQVRERMHAGSEAVPAAAGPRPGTISVHSHIDLADGVELVIEPGRARLTPEQLRRFAREALSSYDRIVRDHD